MNYERYHCWMQLSSNKVSPIECTSHPKKLHSQMAILLHFRVYFSNWNSTKFWFTQHYLFRSLLYSIIRILLLLITRTNPFKPPLFIYLKILDKSFDMSTILILCHLLSMNLVLHMLFIICEVFSTYLAVARMRTRLENDLSILFRLLLRCTQLRPKCLSEEIACWIFSILLVGFQSSLTSTNKYLFNGRNEKKG